MNGLARTCLSRAAVSPRRTKKRLINKQTENNTTTTTTTTTNDDNDYYYYQITMTLGSPRQWLRNRMHGEGYLKGVLCMLVVITIA